MLTHANLQRFAHKQVFTNMKAWPFSHGLPLFVKKLIWVLASQIVYQQDNLFVDIMLEGLVLPAQILTGLNDFGDAYLLGIQSNKSDLSWGKWLTIIWQCTSHFHLWPMFVPPHIRGPYHQHQPRIQPRHGGNWKLTDNSDFVHGPHCCEVFNQIWTMTSRCKCPSLMHLLIDSRN